MSKQVALRQQPKQAMDLPAQVKRIETSNPVDFFEGHMKALWHSKLLPEDKALRLYTLSDSIRKYLNKADVRKAAQEGRSDPYGQLACRRSGRYLAELADDARRLAIESQKVAATEDTEI